MGKKNKPPKKALDSSGGSLQSFGQKLSPQRRNELNQLVEKFLKVSSSVTTTQSNWNLHIEFDKLLTKIIKIESEISKPLPKRDEECAQNLSKWMEENGSVINGIEISEFSDFDYGLMVKKDVSENDIVVTVPRSVMLTTETIKNSELGELSTTDPLLQHMPNVSLALLLILERFKKDSFWVPYINMLPSSYNTVMYFNIKQLKELAGSPCYDAALKHCRNIGRQYAYFYSLFQKSPLVPSLLKEVFTYEHYRWAVSTVMTRQNFVPSENPDSEMVLALIPFWDMINHTNAKLTSEYNVVKKESICYAYRDFKTGEQFLMSYAMRSNHDFFLHNSFVYPENKNDSLKVQLGVSKNDPLCVKRCALLDDLGIQHSGQFTLLLGPSPVPSQLLAFLRVYCMTEVDLEKWISSESKQELESESCIDPTVDSKMWNFLLMRVKLLLSAYPTTMEDDEKLLTPAINPRLRLAVQLRICEKKILNNTLQYTQHKLE